MLRPSFLYKFISYRRQFCTGMHILNFLQEKKCIVWLNICPIHTSLVAFKKEFKKPNYELKKKKSKSMPEIKVWVNMTVDELITAFGCDLNIIEYILQSNESENEVLSQKEILEIANKLHKKCVFIKSPHVAEKKKEEKLDFVRQPPPDPKNLIKRPPVVTIMGHVDHGKTTLLDALRNTFVVDQEFGGITQHIGAFSVEVKSGEKITFIDTPGHAAFTTMRARGAEVTDIVILVVAADDGIMAQTIESIKIAQRAQVKIIVAVNKIDKADAKNIEIIKEQLLVEGIQVEDKGGNIQLIPISAKKKINLDLLVEMILMEAEMMNLKGDPKGQVEGVVIESKVDEKGPLATVIVKRGTMKKHTILLGDQCFARVRLMLDENGKQFNEALPSTALQVWGWQGLPSAGENIFEVSSEKEANKIIKLRKQKAMREKQKQDLPFIEEKIKKDRAEYLEMRKQKITLRTGKEYFNFYKKKYLENLEVKKVKTETNHPQLNVIIKGDVHGSVEVLLSLLNSYDKNDECVLKVVSSSVGNVTLSDIDLAETFDALIYAFNVDVHPSAEKVVKEKKIFIHKHNIIYKMMDDIKEELTARLPFKDVENIIGEAEVKDNFFITVKKNKIPCAGSTCTKGELRKNSLFKIIRDEKVIYNGKVNSMRHFKNDVNVISKNVPCGLTFESFSDEFKPLDKIICYEMVKEAQSSTWELGFNTSEK